jgi:hypothetical protein
MTARGDVPELDYFIGRWEAEAEHPGTGERFELIYAVEPILGGRWYRGAGVAAALGLEIADLWGGDPVRGELVRIITDSSGTLGTALRRR